MRTIKNRTKKLKISRIETSGKLVRKVQEIQEIEKTNLRRNLVEKQRRARIKENQRKQKRHQRKEKGKVKRKGGTSPKKVKRTNQEKGKVKRKGGTSPKKSKKNKSRKNKSKTSKKNRKLHPKVAGNESCMSYLCIDDAVAFLKLLKDRAANHEKQHARTQRQNKTGSSKAGKKGLFGPVVRRIVENGGGNASDLKCNGKTNAGSRQLTNLTETLLKCEDEIHDACDPSNLPQTNMTEVNTCNEAIASFKNTTTKCIKMSGSAACDCWTDETLPRDSAIIKKCDLSDHAKAVAKGIKVCTSAFSKCRKYEDDVGNAIHACNIDTSTLTKKLKNLQTNSAALSSLQTKLNATASRRNIRDANDRQSLSCSAVISTTQTIISLVTQNPVSYSIFTMIQTVITVTFTCTETEKTAIKSVSASVSQAVVMVSQEVTHLKEVFASVTGKEVTDDEIASASLCITEDECDSLVEFPEESSTTAAAAPASAAPSSAAAASMAPSSGAPSSKSPMATNPVSSSPSAAASPEATSPPAEMSPPNMTTGSSTRKARRYLQQMMRKRMVQNLV